MIKVTNILSEILNTYQIEAIIISDKKTNISSIFDEVRALNKVTIVTNITPGDYEQTKPYTKLNQYLGAIGANVPSNQLETTPYFRNTAGGLLQGAGMGVNLAGQIPGLSAGMGALGGGLLGAFL